jgi:hypothetical protein
MVGTLNETVELTIFFLSVKGPSNALLTQCLTAIVAMQALYGLYVALRLTKGSLMFNVLFAKLYVRPFQQRVSRLTLRLPTPPIRTDKRRLFTLLKKSSVACMPSHAMLPLTAQAPRPRVRTPS